MEKKTIYAVSYTSYCTEIYNDVEAYDNIESAIDSANDYLANAMDEMGDGFVLEKNFDNYKGRYQEIEVNDYHNPTTFLISITMFEV